MVPIYVSIQTGCLNPPPTDVRVSDVQPHSIRVSWSGSQSGQNSYTLIYNQLGGENQIDFCINEPLHASITTRDSTVVVGNDSRKRLQAFTTYSMIVAALSDTLGWSCLSQEVVFTTKQTGYCRHDLMVFI